MYKVYFYSGGEKLLEKSGIAKALNHQKEALTLAGVPFVDSDDEDYDIIHINTYGFGSIRAIRKARKQGKKVIVHAHSTEEDFRGSFVGSNLFAPLWIRYLCYIYNKGDKVLTPTPYSKRLLTKRHLKSEIIDISNGIDMQEFAPDPLKEQAFKEYFKIKEDEKVIISVGHFFARKGLFDFVEVAKQLPEYRFIWFGYTSPILIPNKNVKLVEEDHPANVEFPGFISGDILHGAYSASDLFFFPSLEETEGIVTLEAMASKQQVLVRNIPVYEEWLYDNVNCYMGNSVDEFVDKIQKIFNGELPKNNMEGYQTAQERDLANIGKQLDSIYRSVLDK